MKRRTHWRPSLLLSFTTLLFAGLYLTYSHIFYCETIRLSSFKPIDHNLFVSPKIAASDYERILALRHQAKQRIIGFWNSKEAAEVIIVCADPDEYERYCRSQEGAGCSLATLYGSSFIILNLHGLNTDVMSHEMCHSELFHRLGWRKTTFDIPQWFHEGLAMMLDYRFVNASDSLERYHRYVKEWRIRTSPPAATLSLQDIQSLKGFFNHDARHVTLAYLTAATEVSYWLMIVGRPGLYEWEAAMKQGAPFDSYYSIEDRYAAKLQTNRRPNPVRLR